jgi:hypothetical protein
LASDCLQGKWLGGTGKFKNLSGEFEICPAGVSETLVQEAHGEFESEHPGYCGAQDTFYVGNLKGVGRLYQQTFIGTLCQAL